MVQNEVFNEISVPAHSFSQIPLLFSNVIFQSYSKRREKF